MTLNDVREAILRAVSGASSGAGYGTVTPFAQGRLEIGPRVWAVLAGAVVAWRTRNVLWAIVGGMAVFWVLKALGG